MNIWKRLTASFGPQAEMLDNAPHAKPSADEWLVAFTENFVRHPDGAHATHTLMSGLRFFTGEFVASIASLPSPETRKPPIGGSIPRAIYAATGPIIGQVYQKLISQNAVREQIQAAFAQAVPVLVGEYNHSMR
jgi:hypothetical protein